MEPKWNQFSRTTLAETPRRRSPLRPYGVRLGSTDQNRPVARDLEPHRPTPRRPEGRMNAATVLDRATLYPVLPKVLSRVMVRRRGRSAVCVQHVTHSRD